MKPSYFLGYNTVYAKDQPEYQPLPVFKSDTPQGECISCWKLSFLERLIVLFTGKMWLSLYTFNNPLTPSFLTVKKQELLVIKKTPFILKLKFLFVLIRSKVFNCCPKCYSNPSKWYDCNICCNHSNINERWIKYKEQEILKYYEDRA